MEIPGLNPNSLRAEAAVGQAQDTRLQALAEGVSKGGETPEGLAKAAREFDADSRGTKARRERVLIAGDQAD